MPLLRHAPPAVLRTLANVNAMTPEQQAQRIPGLMRVLNDMAPEGVEARATERDIAKLLEVQRLLQPPPAAA
jgi:hypothetical protein